MVSHLRKPPSWHQMHYDTTVKGVWSGSGRDLHPWCGQSEQILVTDVAEAVDCEKCVAKMDDLIPD